MTNSEALASMRQENSTTLRATIEIVKKEAEKDGATRSVGRALDLIELVLRAQEERLKRIEAEVRVSTVALGTAPHR